MNISHSSFHRPARLFLLITLCMMVFSSSYAYEDTTLYNGCKSDDVRVMQEALISLGFLKGTADGIFGINTENAVRRFQKKNKLVADGLAGEKTRTMILSQAGQKKTSSGAKEESPKSSPQAAAASSSAASSGEKYATLRQGSKGERVRSLQQALISLGYLSGKADGVYGSQTRKAVKSFQKSKKLTADGIAGKKTLSALETAISGGQNESQAAAPVPAESGDNTQPETGNEDLNDRISAPSSSSVRLLHWYNVVKPSLSNGQKLLVYDPSSGYSWTLRILARGRHCDAEPLTARDTRTMKAAFGGVNTWSQKAVYVRLPDGRWSLASTHDMPHDTGSIKNNNFNGHLCVHFLRDMDETKQYDPKYGVANQETIRAKWKQLTGEDIP